MGYLVTETTDTGQLIKDCIWLEGMTLAAQIDNSVGIEEITYLHTDHLMTNRLGTDVNQSVVWRWEGEAFGITQPQEFSNVYVNLRFPGQYYDEETNLYYNHFRYYDPEEGRYITSDPIGLAAGQNTYVYAAANPLSFADVNGLEIVGTWIKKPVPSNIKIDVSIGDFSVFRETITTINYTASADIQFKIGCTDTCTGDRWTLDSGRRSIGTSGSYDVNIDGTPPPCIGWNRRTKWACRLMKYKKYQEWARKASDAASHAITQAVYEHFDKIAVAYEKLIDPDTY